MVVPKKFLLKEEKLHVEEIIRQKVFKMACQPKKSFYKTENVHVHAKILLYSGSGPLYRSMYNSLINAELYIELMNFNFPEGN